jgi:hypothetical protein
MNMQRGIDVSLINTIKYKLFVTFVSLIIIMYPVLNRSQPGPVKPSPDLPP